MMNVSPTDVKVETGDPMRHDEQYHEPRNEKSDDERSQDGRRQWPRQANGGGGGLSAGRFGRRRYGLHGRQCSSGRLYIRKASLKGVFWRTFGIDVQRRTGGPRRRVTTIPIRLLGQPAFQPLAHRFDRVFVIASIFGLQVRNR